jgi:tripartite-type tricarboxylate transporter receptor subunit TctC
MTFPRRTFLRLAAGAAALPALDRAAMAEVYPARPVRIVVGLPAGNSPDIVARLVAGWLSDRLNGAFVVENRPGAATGLATEYVVRAQPDGYTLLLALAGNAVNGWVYKLNYDFVTDIMPVASIGGIPIAMVINPSVPAKTVPEFIAYAKANAGKVFMGSSGTGSLPHIFGALFAMMAGIEMTHVPYKESVFPDLLGNRVQVAFEPVPAIVGYVQAGKLRPLGVTTAKPLDVLPGVPPIGQFLPGYEGSGWLGLGAPKGTPAAIVDTVNKAVNDGLADAKFKARLAALGVIGDPMSPAAFGKFIVAETDKWGKVVKFADIKAE